MRHLALACAAALALAAPAADAHQGVQISSEECGFSTPYDVRIGPSGLALTREDGAPSEVLIHDGVLRIDGAALATGAADALRLRRIEAGARALMPQVAAIAREAVDIAFDAFAAVIEGMTGSTSRIERIQEFRASALARVDASLGDGVWDQDLFDEAFAADIEAAAEEFAGSMVRSALWTVLLPGGEGRLERRLAAMEADLDTRMEARADELETRADALCEEVAALHALQESLEIRLDGGAPLRLIEMTAAPAVAAAGQDEGR
ncbi:DUF2884 family protein [Coralloluteibacterium stylophorae]|uniref:DUF2884 family protein n=1 Tax=Coralloluteibacterium stylophorae TaxID=1776034 RepID=A0A8J7VVQ2_9GAMM|nr:DUF2884 family protein [Coralloluteibacterium stylophorae]MBS7458649.1 DUF2884 family protein [Coralloluteibacterium stylophorae]